MQQLLNRAYAFQRKMASERQGQSQEQQHVAKDTALERQINNSRALLGLGHRFSGVTFDSADVDKKHPTMQLILEKYEQKMKRDLLLCGGPGSGKTFNLIAYITKIAKPMDSGGCDAKFIRSSELKDYFRDTRKYSEEIGKLRRKRILMIDDFYVGAYTASFLESFVDLFIARQERAGYKTFITSNASAAELRENFDKRLLSRLSGGLYSIGMVLQTSAPDMRMEESG